MLSTGEATAGMLCPVLGSPTREMDLLERASFFLPTLSPFSFIYIFTREGKNSLSHTFPFINESIFIEVDTFNKGLF